LALDSRKCYIVTKDSLGAGCKDFARMPTQLPHRHGHAGRGHPPASVSPSILRMGVGHRLALSLALIALLWAAVFWAMR
jgi:hypothetical protein